MLRIPPYTRCVNGHDSEGGDTESVAESVSSESSATASDSLLN